MSRAYKYARPTRRELPPPKPRKPKEPPRIFEHRVYGPGKLRRVRILDSGQVADVTFPDGTKRTLLVDALFWLTPVSEILAATPPATVAVEPDDAEEDDSGEASEVSSDHRAKVDEDDDVDMAA